MIVVARENVPAALLALEPHGLVFPRESGAARLITLSGSPSGCPVFTTIQGVHPRWASMGRAVPMTAQYTTEAEYQQQLRTLTRVVSACTLGLWSFSAGLLIGTFFLF